MSNLTLYSTTAVLILDSDGNRILAKYYSPPHAPLPSTSSAGASSSSSAAAAPTAAHAAGQPSQLSARNQFATFKEQRAFEKAVADKTRRASGDIILYDSHLILFKSSLDCTFYLVAPAAENELMLSSALSSLLEAVGMLLHHSSIEKRSLLENLDLVTLAVDETFDDGIIIETDPVTISSRVSRPKPDSVNELQINEQTLMNAYSNLKERVAQRILSGGL